VFFASKVFNTKKHKFASDLAKSRLGRRMFSPENTRSIYKIKNATIYL
jgi:uncharacterized protein (UPF0212 family)